jgi:soluble lytic murein transglycosylase-like protein
MSVHRCSIIAFGVLVLSECIAFGNGNDQVYAQIVQPSELKGKRKVGDSLGSRPEIQDGRNVKANKQQAKMEVQIESSAAVARVNDSPPHSDLQLSDLRDSVCLMIEAAGRAHDLPLEFFARVIWQESRFRPDTVGPRRRDGQRAQGIAQFMPSTAAERGLLDPFDPMQALPKAAQYLRELKDQFGNLGLAAAAYNAGPARVRAWLAGTRELPGETRYYVAAVTGVPSDEWAGARKPAVKTSPNCSELMARIEAPSDPLHGDHQEAPYSHGGMVKQPASSQEPSPSSHGTSAQPDDAQLAQGGRIEALSDPLRGNFVTQHHEGSYSQGDVNLFLEKLTERVKLTADSPWGIQLTAGFSRERVLTAYAAIASEYDGILAGRNASILSSVFRSRGTGVFYQIRIGTNTFESANNLCADIRRAGGACLVLRNGS